MKDGLVLFSFLIVACITLQEANGQVIIGNGFAPNQPYTTGVHGSTGTASLQLQITMPIPINTYHPVLSHYPVLPPLYTNRCNPLYAIQGRAPTTVVVRQYIVPTYVPYQIHTHIHTHTHTYSGHYYPTYRW